MALFPSERGTKRAHDATGAFQQDEEGRTAAEASGSTEANGASKRARTAERSDNHGPERVRDPKIYESRGTKRARDTMGVFQEDSEEQSEAGASGSADTKSPRKRVRTTQKNEEKNKSPESRSPMPKRPSLFHDDLFAEVEEPRIQAWEEETVETFAQQPHRQLPPRAYDINRKPVDVVHPKYCLQRSDQDIWIRAVRKIGQLSHCVLFRLELEPMTYCMEPFYLMFDPEMPIMADEYRDGIPVITFEQEKAESWALMAQLFYEPLSFAEGQVFWQDALTLLELSRKYGCILFLDAALSILTSYWPTKLDSFLNREKKCKIIGMPPSAKIRILTEVALKYELVELLPVARFDLASCSLAQLMCGWKDEVTGERITLPADELERIVRGRERLVHTRRRLTLGAMSTESKILRNQCGSGQQRHGYDCGTFIARVAMDCEEHTQTFYEETARAMRILDRNMMNEIKPYLCENCRRGLKIAMKAGQREAWRDLPSMFGMGEWFDVERDRNRIRERRFEWFYDKEIIAYARAEEKKREEEKEAESKAKNVAAGTQPLEEVEEAEVEQQVDGA